jgi:hypothetical protein
MGVLFTPSSKMRQSTPDSLESVKKLSVWAQISSKRLLCGMASCGGDKMCVAHDGTYAQLAERVRRERTSTSLSEEGFWILDGLPEHPKFFTKLLRCKKGDANSAVF